MTVKAAFIQADTYSASATRGALAALAEKDDSGAVRDGVFQPQNGALGVSANGTPNMTVKVAAGSAMVTGYVFTSDAITTVTVSASSPTNARIDLIIARVQDSEAGDDEDEGTVEIVTGTPAASPSVPTLPDRAIPLAQIAVAADASSITSGNITDVRVSTSADGGVIWAPNTAGLPSSPSDGQIAYQDDISTLKVSTPDGWRLMPGSSLVDVTFALNGGSTNNRFSQTNSTYVTFMTGTFTLDADGKVAFMASGNIIPTVIHNRLLLEILVDGTLAKRVPWRAMDGPASTPSSNELYSDEFMVRVTSSLTAGSHTVTFRGTRDQGTSGASTWDTLDATAGREATLTGTYVGPS